MKILVQPEHGITPLIQAIAGAESSIQIAIFRFDLRALENALIAAAARGVAVRALIAHVNGGEEAGLRSLESRLGQRGVAVRRTANDLVRYHGKYMIVDRARLYVLAFNFTARDAERSRSFGVATSRASLVREAVNLFEADWNRLRYSQRSRELVVSPSNSRSALRKFIRGAKRRLLIYDPRIVDAAMIRALEERKKAGVDVRVVGAVGRAVRFPVRELTGTRHHAQCMLRDGDYVFLGSQSLRTIELDRRREVGVIVKSRAAVSQIVRVFENDWRGARETDPTPLTRFGNLIALATAKLRATLPKWR